MTKIISGVSGIGRRPALVPAGWRRRGAGAERRARQRLVRPSDTAGARCAAAFVRMLACRLAAVACGGRSRFFALLAATACLGLSACAGFGVVGEHEWPPALPPLSFFDAAYAQDAANHDYQTRHEYLNWVRRFYTGTALYPRGWNAITRDVLAAIPGDERRARLADALHTLGRDIAAEWSKSNRVSLVKSGHLAVWGVAAERAVAEGNLEETLDSIETDVRGLLRQQLAPGAITASRYHEQDPDDIFAF